MTIAVDAKLKRATGRAAEELIPMLVWLAASYAAANAALFGNLAPFGISCAAAAKKKTLLPATAGAILGYTLAGGGSLRYPAAVLLVAAVKLIFEKLGEGALPSALYAAASTLVVSTAFASLGAEIGMPQIMAEAVLCGGVAWFFSRTGVLLGDGRPILALSKADRACIAVTAAIGAASLAGTEMFGVSAGAVLGGFAVLLSAEYGGEGSGAAAGAAAGTAIGVASGYGMLAAAGFPVGGLVAGVFAVFGRTAAAAAFACVQLIAAFAAGAENYGLFYSSLVAGGVLILLPKQSGKVAALFAPRESLTPDSATVKSILLARLGSAAAGLSDISTATKRVSDKLRPTSGDDLNRIFNFAAEKACRTCSRNAYCWQERYSDTMEAFSAMAPALKKEGAASEADFPEEFAKRCIRAPEIARTISLRFAETVERREARHEISGIRSVVTDQFDGMALMLRDLAGDMARLSRSDQQQGRAVKRLLEHERFHPFSAVCYYAEGGRLTVEATLPLEEKSVLEREELTAMLSDLLLRDLSAPVARETENARRLVWSERPPLAVEYGEYAFCADGEKFCGDSSRFLYDERGRAHLLLSDGMGSGCNAALDSAMTAGLLERLIRAGFRFDSAIRLVNSALLLKSGDESLATADSCELDLFCGRADFCKAGAAPSYVLKHGRAVRVSAMSLPAGILGGTAFEEENLTLGPGDWIVMVSDGAIAEGDDWILKDMKTLPEKTAPEAARYFAERAKAIRSDGHSDDITVLAAKLVENGA